jgi:hypothetical protein
VGESIQVITLELPIPPSVNHIWVHSRRGHYLHPKYREWLTQFEAIRLGAKVSPIPGPVSITVEVMPGAGFRKGRDLDNLLKAIKLITPNGGPGLVRLSITPIPIADVIDPAPSRKRATTPRRNKKKDISLFDQIEINPCLLSTLGRARRKVR